MCLAILPWLHLGWICNIQNGGQHFYLQARVGVLDNAHDIQDSNHRHFSRSSSNYQSHEEETEWRRQHHHHHHHHGDRHHHEAKPYLPFVKLPSFSGDSDPNVYLGWEAKYEQIFYVHEVKDD